MNVAVETNTIYHHEGKAQNDRKLLRGANLQRLSGKPWREGVVQEGFCLGGGGRTKRAKEVKHKVMEENGLWVGNTQECTDVVS